MVAEIDTLGATLKRVELLAAQGFEGSDQEPSCCSAPSTTTKRKAGSPAKPARITARYGACSRASAALAPGRDVGRGAAFGATARTAWRCTKIYTFRRDSYVIDVALELRNAGGAPASTLRLLPAHARRQARCQPTNSVASTRSARRASSASRVYTNEHKYQKVHLSDLDKGKADHVKQADNGWLAFVQHYFVSAWLPPRGDAARLRHRKAARTAPTPAG